MIHTATSHQEATESFWLGLGEAIMSSVSTDQIHHLISYSLTSTARLLSSVFVGCFMFCGCFLCISLTQQVCQNFYCWLTWPTVSRFHDL